MVAIVIDRVTKRFGDFTAIDAMDISFDDGAVTCLLGPSGCGKTTLMRMIVGLERPTSGRILFDGRDMTGLPARKRNVGMVFQYPVMYPTLSVEENIRLPLEQDRGIDRAERDRRVDEVLEVLDMTAQRRAFIGDLDAGGRQKVAVGRAVARQSDVVLFDEPTTNVEVFAKLQLIRAFKLVTQRLRQTIVYVTHDQTEAMTLADRIALMNAGRIVQYERPDRLYRAPQSEFAGWFLGNPGMNFLPARLDGQRIVSALGATAAQPGDSAISGRLTMGVRPEALSLAATPTPGSIPGTLLERTVGIAGRYLSRVRVAEEVIKVKTDAPPPVGPGEPIHLAASPAALFLFADGDLVRPLATLADISNG